MATLRSVESACPLSSNAMTMTAAPYFLMTRAWRMNSASPSLSEMELTTPLPWMRLRPASMTSKRELSTMTGTRDMSGSAASRFRYRSMAASESSRPSSMLTSSIWAPSSTCWRATATASSYLPRRIRRLNRAEPVTFARSPTLTKLASSRISSASMPLRSVLAPGSGRRLGRTPETASAMACVCSGLDPQQLPTMLVRPLRANSPRLAAMWDADSSYSPNSLGRPALG